MREIPVIGRQGRIVGATMLVVIECPCGSPQGLCLVQAQKALCEACGRVHQMNSCAWSKDQPLPTVDITSSLSRAELLMRQ